MAKKLSLQYTGRTIDDSASFPGGSFKNETTVGAEDGTPLESGWQNDQLGLIDGILGQALYVHDGVSDTALVSQRLEALRDIIGTTMPPYMDAHDFCAEDGSCQIENPARSPNVASYSANIRDSCIGLDRRSGGTGRPCIFTTHEDNTVWMATGINKWGGSGSFTATELTIQYPTTPAYVCGVCCDGTNLYISWFASAGNIMVSAFALTDPGGVAVWTCNTGVSSTWGAPGESSRMIASSDTTIAIMLPSSAVLISKFQIGIITVSDGSILKGTGSWVSGTGDHPAIYKMVTDKSHVYWIQSQNDVSTRDYYLMSAKISDPTESDYDSELIESGVVFAESSTLPKALSCIRGNVVIANSNGVFWMFNPLTNSCWKQYDISGSFPAAMPGLDNDCFLAFDNINLWYITALNNPAKSFYCAFKIPMGYFSKYITAAAEQDLNHIPFCVIDTENIDVSAVIGGKLHFACGNMYFQIREKNIFRIVSSGLR